MTCQWHPPGVACDGKVVGRVRIGKFNGLVCITHQLRLQVIARLEPRRLSFKALPS